MMPEAGQPGKLPAPRGSVIGALRGITSAAIPATARKHAPIASSATEGPTPAPDPATSAAPTTYAPSEPDSTVAKTGPGAVRGCRPGAWSRTSRSRSRPRGRCTPTRATPRAPGRSATPGRTRRSRRGAPRRAACARRTGRSTTASPTTRRPCRRRTRRSCRRGSPPTQPGRPPREHLPDERNLYAPCPASSSNTDAITIVDPRASGVGSGRRRLPEGRRAA